MDGVGRNDISQVRVPLIGEDVKGEQPPHRSLMQMSWTIRLWTLPACHLSSDGWVGFHSSTEERRALLGDEGLVGRNGEMRSVTVDSANGATDLCSLSAVVKKKKTLGDQSDSRILLQKSACCCLEIKSKPPVFKGALRSFGEALQTQSFDVDNVNYVIMHTLFHDWINKPFSEENKHPRRLFEAREVAGSATYKQSKTVWSCGVLLRSVCFFSLCSRENKREFVCLVCSGIQKKGSVCIKYFTPIAPLIARIRCVTSHTNFNQPSLSLSLSCHSTRSQSG